MEPITRKIFALHLKKVSGKAVIHKDETTRMIFFKKGVPIYTESNVREETLGQMLLKDSNIDEDQYLKVLERMKITNQKQGEVLVELGFLSAYQVYEALKAQTLKRFHNCLGLEGAEFNFLEGVEQLVNVSEFPIDISRVMFDTLMFEISLAEHPTINPEQAIRLTSEGVDYLNQASLTALERKDLRLLDGKRPWQDILTKGSGDTESFVYVLLGLKFAALIPLRTYEEVTGEKRLTPPSAEADQRKTIVIEEKKNTSPIFLWGLKCDRPLPELLEVNSSSTRIQIRKNYETKIRELHLDQIEQVYKGEERVVAERVLDRMTLAVTVLTNEQMRNDYINRLRTHQAEKFSPAVEAEVCAQKAKLYVLKKNFQEAKAILEKARNLMPEEASYLIEYSDILIKESHALQQKPPTEVKDLINKALGMNTKNVEAFYALGVYYKITGDPKKAMDAFQKLVAIQPNHGPANSELRLLRMRDQGDKKESPKLFGGLFSRKEANPPEEDDGDDTDTKSGSKRSKKTK